LGVPPMLLGIPGDNTYANIHEPARAALPIT
jgi:phage portal protein BeeE